MKRGGPLRRSTPLRASKGLDRGKPLERSTPLPRRRAKPRRTAVESTMPAGEWRTLVLSRAGYRCEVGVDGCTGTATEAHHRYRLGRPNLPANGVACCSSCHTGGSAAIHRNPRWAYEVGLLISASAGPPTERWTNPSG